MHLQDGVHAVRAGSQVIVLNERANRYSALSDRQALALQSMGAGAADGWPEVLLPLVEKGLLNTAPPQAPAQLSPSTPPPRASLIEADFDLGLGFRDIPSVLAVFSRAKRTIERNGLIEFLAWQRSGKARGAPASVHRVARRFLAARSWAPVAPRCLIDSVALLEFLRDRGLGAEIVFGVRPTPFEAHCWVEHDGVVLNDTVLRARTFTPILVA